MTPVEKLRRAMEISSLGLQMKKESLQRENPSLTSQEIGALFNQWMYHRDSAPHGDYPGPPGFERVLLETIRSSYPGDNTLSSEI